MDSGPARVKMSGYLHLKTKKRMISSWKCYWFVLEDRLLLYYRSKTEYDAISPCKGSISLGPPCTVKSLPSVQNSFQIETRTVTYTLKADNSEEQKKWLQAILSSLNQNQNFVPVASKRLSHFRYSLDNLVPEVEPNDAQLLQSADLQRQNTLPRTVNNPTKDVELIQRLQKMGAHSYGGSLEAITKMVHKKVLKPALSAGAAGGSRESLGEEKRPVWSARSEEERSNHSQISLPGEEILRPRRDMEENLYERISGQSQNTERESFLVDNENYSVPLRKSASAVEGDRDRVVQRQTKSLLVENDQYGVPPGREVIYAVPKTDCNKNSLLLENTFYACSDVVNRSEHIYEDLDKFNDSSRPVLVTSSHTLTETKPLQRKKSRSFIKRVWKKKKKEKKEEDEDIYTEINPTSVEKLEVSDDGAIQMLSELHNILEKKKSELKTAISPHQFPDIEVTPPEDSDSACPSLPPKIHKQDADSTYKPSVEQPRSLDEILEDLDKEKMEAKSKVQMLIEKFNEPEDVVLRRHDNTDSDQYRHSDDLNLLLEELAKVTTAPIMTPGVTSSLVGPNLTDEEWLKLLPLRQRRLSDPDYDVPRPHSSIQLPPFSSQSENRDVIPATRFFGPILAPPESKEDSPPVSMTPDSLEVVFEPHIPHHYVHQNESDDKIIYALPKSYFSLATHVVTTCQNIGGGRTQEGTTVYKSVKNIELQGEVFKDSLELCSETSTEF